jgi:hypothetical protein
MKTSKGTAIAYWISTSLFGLQIGFPMTKDRSRTWSTHP